MAFVLRALARNNDRVHGVVDENMNWDLNEDSKLNKEEMRAMKRADKAKYLRFIKADKDGDRVLDEDELQVAEEGERKYQSILRLRKLKAILKNRLNQRSAYWAFMFYTAFLALYLGLLYQQADVERKREGREYVFDAIDYRHHNMCHIYVLVPLVCTYV